MNMDLNIYQVNVINKYKKIEWEVNIEIYGLALCAATNKDQAQKLLNMIYGLYLDLYEKSESSDQRYSLRYLFRVYFLLFGLIYRLDYVGFVIENQSKTVVCNMDYNMEFKIKY